MLVNFNLIQNRRGQTVVETTFVLGVLVTTTLITLKLAFKLVLLMAIDDFLESYLMCATYQPQSYCRTELQRKTNFVSLRLDSIRLIEQTNKLVASVQVSNGLYEKFQRSREYIKR